MKIYFLYFLKFIFTIPDRATLISYNIYWLQKVKHTRVESTEVGNSSSDLYCIA